MKFKLTMRLEHTLVIYDIIMILFRFQLKHSRASPQFTSIHKRQTQDNLETLNPVSYKNAYVIKFAPNYFIINYSYNTIVKTCALYSTAFIARNLRGS